MIVYEIETGKDLGDQDTPKFLLPDHSAPKPGYIIKPIYTPDKKAVLESVTPRTPSMVVADRRAPLS